MGRLIDADLFKEDMTNVFPEYYEEVLDAQPTVDAEPVRRGKWEMKSDPFGFFDEIPVCSECGCTTKMREKTKYCPHCGARMDEEL